MRTKGKIRIVGIAIAILFISLLAAIHVYNLNNKDTYLMSDGASVFGYRPVIVVSGSMIPAMEINSIAIIKMCNIDELEVGDVALFKHPRANMKVIHRVTDIHKDYGGTWVETKGDNNPESDNWQVMGENVYGKVATTLNWVAPFMNGVSSYDGSIDYQTLGLKILIVVLASVLLVYGGHGFLVWVIYLYDFRHGRKRYNELMVEIDDSISDIHRIKERFSELESGKQGIITTIKRARLVIKTNDYLSSMDDVNRITSKK